MASPKKHDAPRPDDVEGGVTPIPSFVRRCCVGQPTPPSRQYLSRRRTAKRPGGCGWGTLLFPAGAETRNQFSRTHARTAVGVAKQALETKGGFRKSTMMTPTSSGTATASVAKFPKPHMTTDRLVSGGLRIGHLFVLLPDNYRI